MCLKCHVCGIHIRDYPHMWHFKHISLWTCKNNQIIAFILTLSIKQNYKIIQILRIYLTCLLLHLKSAFFWRLTTSPKLWNYSIAPRTTFDDIKNTDISLYKASIPKAWWSFVSILFEEKLICEIWSQKTNF